MTRHTEVLMNITVVICQRNSIWHFTKTFKGYDCSQVCITNIWQAV